MRVVIAPDSFKGSLTADRVAAAIAEGIGRVLPAAECVLRPVADGGEGTVAAALRAGYVERTARVTGPDGRPVDAVFATDGGTAVLELAAAAGLGLLDRPAPLTASTYGVGELVLAALDADAHRIVLGLGGSGTTDGGAGMLQALGFRLVDAAGRDILPGGAGLAGLEHVDATARDARLADVEITVAVDVDNSLTGPRGAAAVFGPQKGATPDEVRLLDAALARFAATVRRDLGIELEGRPALGAAGGTAAGAVVLGARVVVGAAMVCDLVRLDEALAGARLVITGEGRLDEQTLSGKAPAEVAARAAAAGVPCVALAGAVSMGPERWSAAGFTAAHALSEVEPDVARCLGEPERLLAELAARVVPPLLRGV